MTHHRPPWRACYARCAAPGCLQTPRRFSRYCGHHYRTLERTRDIRGRVLTKGELRGHRELALEFLDRNASHPAVIAALEHMAELLGEDGRAGFLRGEFQRLRDNGATPRAMLGAFLAVYGWADCHARELADRCFDLNLGRAVLGVVPAKRRTSRTGRKHWVRIPPGHAEALGANLRCELGVFGLVVTKHVRRMVDAGHVDADGIKEALQVPFQGPPEAN